MASLVVSTLFFFLFLEVDEVGLVLNLVDDAVLGGNTFALCCRLANSPPNDQALIPRTCEYLTLHGKGDLADVTD